MRAPSTIPVPHLLLQSPFRRGCRARKGLWLLPRCHSGGNHPMVSPELPWGRGAALGASPPFQGRAAAARAASLRWGKCVTGSGAGLGRFEPHGSTLGTLGTEDSAALSQQEPLSRGRREKESPSCGRTRWGAQCWPDGTGWAARQGTNSLLEGEDDLSPSALQEGMR